MRCRVDSLLAVIGDQWTLGIIHKLSLGPWRTLELHSSFKGMSTKTLASRLNLLVKNGIVTRKSYPQRPPRVEYSLTERGRQLLPILDALAELAVDWYGSGTTQASDACPACLAYQGNTARTRAEGRAATQTTTGGEAPERARPKKRTDITLL
jgi:DNA-binding HxlR family transcriptional regulator